MNITEISVKDRVLIERGKTKEMAKVKGFLPNGMVLVATTEGKIWSIAPEQIIKRFSEYDRLSRTDNRLPRQP